MIIAHLTTAAGTDSLLMVLEPGNIERLKKGLPIHKFIAEFGMSVSPQTEIVICYCPDTEWVSEQVQSGRLELGEALQQSLSRAPIIREGMAVRRVL